MTLPTPDSVWSNADRSLATVRVVNAFYTHLGTDVVNTVDVTDATGAPCEPRKTQYAAGAFHSTYRREWTPTVGDRVILVEPGHQWHCRDGVLAAINPGLDEAPLATVDIDPARDDTPGGRTCVSLAHLRPEAWGW